MTSMQTIDELSVISPIKYEIIAKDINNADSKIEEWEIDLYFLVINVAITPKINPINTEKNTSYMKLNEPSPVNFINFILFYSSFLSISFVII